MTHHGENKHFKAYQVLVIMFMAIGSIAYGYSGSIIGTTLGQPSFREYMNLSSSDGTSVTGAIVALFYAGGFVGSFCQGWVSNRWGRKAAIIMGCTMLIVSAAFLAGSVNPAMFIVFRFFNGWGATQLNCVVPLWIAEISPPRYRATLTVLHTVGINLGNNIAGLIGIGFYYTSGKNQWRGPTALQIVPAAIVLCGIFWMPESPRYLLSKDRTEEAWAITRRLHSDSGDHGDEFAKREFYQMRKQAEVDMTYKTSYVEIFKKPSHRKRALMTMFFTFSLMSVGALVINSYGTFLYSSLGYDTVASLWFETGWTMVGTFCNLLSMTVVDRIPRNILFSTGFFFVLVILIIEAVLQELFLGTDNKGGLAAAVAILFIYNAFYGVFLEGAPFYFIAEIWPTHLRAQGYALGIGALCATILLWTQVAPVAFAAIGWKYYIVFMVFAVIACVVSAVWFPNTLHKPLEEIAVMFGDADEVAVYQKDLETTDAEVTEEIEKTVPVTIHEENVV